MWTVVYLAQKEAIAEALREKLENEGILVKVRRAGGNPECEGYEILVPETEIKQAHEIIIDNDFKR
ncbi:MAG: hypothetical protein IJT38_00335 [Clostridia bacterium]|nr:hypothetical protein [Clostridia bacterium]